MRPLLTEIPPMPFWMPVAFHASGGPSFGHSLSSPVSFDCALRSALLRPVGGECSERAGGHQGKAEKDGVFHRLC